MQYVESIRGGKNSIDFQIITELGVLVGKHEADYAYVISQDQGRRCRQEKAGDRLSRSPAGWYALFLFVGDDQAIAAGFALVDNGQAVVIAVAEDEEIVVQQIHLQKASSGLMA